VLPLLVLLMIWEAVVRGFNVNPRVFAPIEPVLRAGIAWIPIATLWFGDGLGATTFVILNAVFFVVAYNTLLGMTGIPMALTHVSPEARQTIGTRLAASAAGEITSMSKGTRQRSVRRTFGGALLSLAPSKTYPSKPLAMTSLQRLT
jgi:hypothetical protein